MLVFSSAQAISLTTDTTLATAGFYRLSWQDAAGANSFELVESDNPEFRDAQVIYQGPDTATVITGRSNGQYYYRIRPVDSASANWSKPLEVVVQHHSLARAMLFFVIGLLVFVITLSTILIASRGEKQEPDKC